MAFAEPRPRYTLEKLQGELRITNKFPPLGKKGSFATPYRTSTASAGVFLFADASVRTIRSDINVNDLRNLLGINDANAVGEIPQLEVPRQRRRSRPQVQFIEIIRGKDGLRARFVSETRELVFEGSSSASARDDGAETTKAVDPEPANDQPKKKSSSKSPRKSPR